MGSKKIINEEQFKQQVYTYKQMLLEQIPDLFASKDERDTKLYHKSSRMPRVCWLYVSAQPKVSKFTVGIKIFNKIEKDKLYEVHENLPIDLKCRARKTLKYTDINVSVKYNDIPTVETFEKIRTNLDFFKQAFSEFFIN